MKIVLLRWRDAAGSGLFGADCADCRVTLGVGFSEKEVDAMVAKTTREHHRPSCPTRSPRPGHVYFVSDGESIKIGFTANGIRKRLESLRNGNPRELTVLAVVEGNIETERSLHHRFDHLRIRGEWFRAERDLLDFIAEQKR